MSESSDLTYYQKNRYVMLNRAKYYYENKGTNVASKR